MQQSLFYSSDLPLLTVLSFGAGQDSSALLEMYFDSMEFRAQYAPRDFLVVCSDTGDEFPDTYAHIRYVQKKCNDRGVEFVHLTSDMGFHSESWRSLRHFYRTHECIGSKAYPKTCSGRLKIEPIYRFMEAWISKKYGMQNGRKKGLREFALSHGKIQMMIGIAKGEEKRCTRADEHVKSWYRDTIHHQYPLIDLGMDRNACQNYLHSKGLRVVPSNCMACPFMSLEEVEYLRRFHLESLTELVELEAAKMRKHATKNKVIVTDREGNVVRDCNGNPKTKNMNYGVFGVTPLKVVIENAKAKCQKWSDAQVMEYRYSHGHCVSSKF